MGLSKRRDSYYVELKVLDNGKTLTLANGIHCARLKRRLDRHKYFDFGGQLEALERGARSH